MNAETKRLADALWTEWSGCDRPTKVCLEPVIKSALAALERADNEQIQLKCPDCGAKLTLLQRGEDGSIQLRFSEHTK